VLVVVEAELLLLSLLLLLWPSLLPLLPPSALLQVKLPCTIAGLTAAAAVLKTDPNVSITITGGGCMLVRACARWLLGPVLSRGGHALTKRAC
jgi:hypothetical protein